jgi:hypothetical protein
MTKWWLVALMSLAVVPGTSASEQDRGGGPRTLGDSAADLVYTPVAPCRIVDTRLAGGTLTTGVPRSFLVTGTVGFEAQGGKAGGCAVPDGATAVMVNFVAVAAAGPGNLQAWPFGEPVPLASIINYAAVGLNIANGVAVPICNPAVTTCAFDLTVQANVSAIQLVADVLGFFRTTGPVGDMTAVNAGTGLTGGGTSGDVTLSVDSSTTQLRVNGTCPPGSSIRAINENGTVLCQTDTNSGGTVTSVAAGTGLLGGTITTSGTISANFAGTGSANTIARSDHTHAPPAVTNAIFGVGPITHFTGNGWVLEATNATTLQLRTTAANFFSYGIVHPINCGAGTADLRNVFRFSTSVGDTLSGTLCDLGSQMTITVHRFNDTNATLFRCWRETGNHNACQRLF